MAAGDLTDLPTLKAHLKISVATDDAVLTALITHASDTLASDMCRVIAQTTVTHKHHGKGGTRLTLREFPVISIGSVLIDGVTIPASSGVSVNGWYQSGDREIALRGYTFTRGFGNVVVTYTAGYATIPPRFASACLRTCERWYKELERIGHASKSIEGMTVAFALGYPDDVKRMILTERDVVPA